MIHDNDEYLSQFDVALYELREGVVTASVQVLYAILLTAYHVVNQNKTLPDSQPIAYISMR